MPILPKDDNVFKEDEEHKHDTAAHPHIQRRDVADLGRVLPHGPEHGGQGEQGRHGHPRPPGDRLGREKQREPGHDHKQTWGVNSRIIEKLGREIFNFIMSL